TSPGACAHGCPNPLKPSGDHDGPPRATQRARACGPALPAGSSGERLEAPSAGHRRAAQSGGAQRSPWRLHTAHRTAPIDDRLCWEDFGCASHLQGTRESRNRWARPPSAGRRAASRRGAGKRTRRGRPRTSARYARSSSPSRRVEKAITKNPAPSAATTKSARSTCLCTVGNSQLQHTCAPQGAGIVSNPTAPGAMLPQRRAQRC
ncbi:unnamed protein product, partial [Prorocentrum cordatum]